MDSPTQLWALNSRLDSKEQLPQWAPTSSTALTWPVRQVSFDGASAPPSRHSWCSPPPGSQQQGSAATMPLFSYSDLHACPIQALCRYEHEDLDTDTESTGGEDTCHATRKRVATAPRESCDNTVESAGSAAPEGPYEKGGGTWWWQEGHRMRKKVLWQRHYIW